MSLITTENLCVSHGQVQVLKNMNFSILPGEIVTIVGPNGSGKSTFLKALVGAIRPSSGKVRHGKNLKIGYVPQRLEVDRIMPLTVDRFLALAGQKSFDARSAALIRVGVDDLSGRQMASLSGGQYQRVLLAHAMLRDPDILVLDEATQGLDQPGTAGFYQLISDLRAEKNWAVLMVSHDLHVVMSASDRVICLNGHICCEGTPTVVSKAPEYRALFGVGSGGALALYRHEHDHSHDGSKADDHGAH